MPEPQKAPPIPQREDANVARDRELRRRAGAQGFSSTIMGDAVAKPTDAGNVQAKTLLGG
jgi:hypothetical protein